MQLILILYSSRISSRRNNIEITKRKIIYVYFSYMLNYYDVVWFSHHFHIDVNSRSWERTTALYKSIRQDVVCRGRWTNRKRCFYHWANNHRLAYIVTISFWPGLDRSVWYSMNIISGTWKYYNSITEIILFISKWLLLECCNLYLLLLNH